MTLLKVANKVQFLSGVVNGTLPIRASVIVRHRKNGQIFITCSLRAILNTLVACLYEPVRELDEGKKCAIQQCVLRHKTANF